MKVAVCYKCVPFNEAIEVNRDRSLDFSKCSWEIGQYDLNAAEAGVQLADQAGAEAVALTANIPAVAGDSKLRKSILCRGMSQQYAVEDEVFASADSLVTAKALKAAVEKIEDVEVVVCGEGSGDIYAQQVGNTLGALLGWTTLNAVSKAEYVGDKLNVERNVSDGIEQLTVELPVVLSVTSEINHPRVPSFKEIMAAGKKPFTIWKLGEIESDFAPAYNTLGILAPETAERKQIIIDGNEEGALDEFVSYIKKAL